MTTAETNQSGIDIVKLLFAIAIVVAGLYGFYAYADQYILLYRVLALVALVAVALVVAYQTSGGKTLWSYLQASRAELRKVVWPTRTETTQTTIIVVVVVSVTGLLAL